MTVYKLSEIPDRELLDRAEARFVHASAMTFAYWTFEPGVHLPDHTHPHEQISSVIEGVFDLTVDGESMRLEAGSVVVIPPNARHSGDSVTECRIIDVFHPVREDYR
jgi:quercetin dioxygenase-like cupin family protein